jgi:hypothetical protein
MKIRDARLSFVRSSYWTGLGCQRNHLHEQLLIAIGEIELVTGSVAMLFYEIRDLGYIGL